MYGENELCSWLWRRKKLCTQGILVQSKKVIRRIFRWIPNDEDKVQIQKEKKAASSGVSLGMYKKSQRFKLDLL